MIDRLCGKDADLIIEDRWPSQFDEEKVLASAAHHRDVVATTLGEQAHEHLRTGMVEASTRNAGAFAEASTNKSRTHLRYNDASVARHLAIADELEKFGQAIISGKNRINGAVSTFTEAWGQAPELAKANNWYQHDYNQYRSRLVDEGRATVTEALHQINSCNDQCLRALRTSLEA